MILIEIITLGKKHLEVGFFMTTKVENKKESLKIVFNIHSIEY